MRNSPLRQEGTRFKEREVVIMNAVSPSLFNVLILYNTPACAVRAVGVYQRLRQSLEPNYRFRLQSWRFGMMESPSVALWARRDAAAADMVIVAWSSESPGLNGIRGWLEEWPSGAGDSRRALVSLFVAPPSRATDLAAEAGNSILRRVADRTGMDLIASDASGEDLLPSGERNEPDQALLFGPGFCSPRLEPTVGPVEFPMAYSRWGINE